MLLLVFFLMAMVLTTPIPANIKLKATTTTSGTQSTRSFSLILPTYTPTSPKFVHLKKMNSGSISFNNKQEILESQNKFQETKWIHSHQGKRDTHNYLL